jgi:hypothetical protein
VAGRRAGRASRREATSVVDEKKPRRFGAIGINWIRASYFSLFLSIIEVDLGGHKNREVFSRAIGECFFNKIS